MTNKHRISLSNFSDSINKFHNRSSVKINPTTIEILYKVIDYDG